MRETLFATRGLQLAEDYSPVAEAEAITRAAALETAAQQLPRHERGLTEADNLNRWRGPDGQIPEFAKRAVLQNLVTWVKEGAIPQAVSTVDQPYEDGTFWWDEGRQRSTIDVAESGYQYHSPWAYSRVAVEVAEAEHNARTLQPGVIQAFISPKVSAKDAPYEDAKKEHLADDDMIRIHWVNTGPQGEITGKSMQSLLVRDVPLSAWVAMLQAPDNIFGRQIIIDDPESSLAVMQVFRELELPAERLPEGVVSLIEAVLPHVPLADQTKVEKQLALFRGDQLAIHELAERIAKRWLHFEVRMADSLHAGRAHPVIADFVEEMWDSWTDDDHSLLNLHTLADGSLGMSRALAARLQQAKQNLLLVPAAVVVQNERVLEQIDPRVARQIQMEEMRIQQMVHEGRSMEEVTVAERAMNQMVAKENVKVGAGCAGDNFGNFRQEKKKKQPGQEDDKTQSTEEKKAEEANNKSKWKWSRGLCLIGNCPTRPGKTMVGPCSVCWKCQKKFDRGSNLESIMKEYTKRQQEKARFDKVGEAAGSATTGEQVTETPQSPVPVLTDASDPHAAESPSSAPLDTPRDTDHDEKA